jgi:hypothetical protein
MYAPPYQITQSVRDGPRTASARASILPALLVAAIFIPEPLSFFIGAVRLSAARVILLVAIPVILFSSGAPAGSIPHRRPLSDFLFPLAAAWMVLAFAASTDLVTGLKSGGVDALELLMPYAVMRYLLRDERQVHAIIRLFCLLAAVSGLLGLLDTFTGTFVLREGLSRLTGYSSTADMAGQLYWLQRSYRLGLPRATGPIEMPIVFGIMNCYGLMLSGDLAGWRRWFCRLGCGIGLFISLSSGPWLATMIGFSLFAYRRAMARFPRRWPLIIGTGSAVLVLFYMAHPDPWGFIFNHLTLDASSGYYRMVTWQVGGASVLQNPLFGIGLRDFYRPESTWIGSSVDTLWLELALKVGIPGSLLTGLALIGASSRLSPTALGIGERGKKLAETLGIVTFLTIFQGFTVDYWGAVWVTIGMLAGIRACLGELSWSAHR